MFPLIKFSNIDKHIELCIMYIFYKFIFFTYSVMFVLIHVLVVIIFYFVSRSFFVRWWIFKCRFSSNLQLCLQKHTEFTNPLLIQANFLRMEYSEVPLIRPSTVPVESGLNGKQVSLMRPISIEKCILILKRVALIGRVVLIPSGLYCGTLLYLKLEFCDN